MATEDGLQRIARVVRNARLDHGWTKEFAAGRAGVSSITWKRVEDGLRVQDVKRRAVEVALGWRAGSMESIALGGELADFPGPGPVASNGEGTVTVTPGPQDAAYVRQAGDGEDQVSNTEVLEAIQKVVREVARVNDRVAGLEKRLGDADS